MADFWFPILVGIVLAVIYVSLIIYARRGPKLVSGLDSGDLQRFEQTRIEQKRSIRPPTRSIRPPTRRQSKVLTPRMLERVNIQRRLANRPPLNRAGFQNAVSSAWDQPQRPPLTTTDWLTYLILYQCFLGDHQSHTVSGVGGITIDPDKPYFGQGGEFAGAGASGTWDSTTPPDDIRAAVAAASTISTVYEHADLSSNDPYGEHRAPSVADPVPAERVISTSPALSAPYGSDPSPSPSPSYSAPDPSPSYSAPDPSPSYSSDSGSSSSSYSSDSGSSSSFSSGDGS